MISSHVPDVSRREFVRAGLAALAATATVGCGGVTQPAAQQGPGSARLSARPGTPTGSPTLGESPLGLGAPRDGWLYVPSTYDTQTPTPLLVLLHGATGAADNWLNYQARGEASGVIILAIDSRDRTWDIIQTRFSHDIAFMDSALGQTFGLCNIDPTRLALGGFSDGASYALSVGLSNGDLFSHVVAFSPGFVITPTRAGLPRVYISHGDADTILPVNLSRDDIVPDLRADGYDVTFDNFDGPHTVPPEVADRAFEWLLGMGA
ncbi:MAG: alpha/beta hydrolase-fold protein [Gemmatimonadota bacterium]|nr:alpha/beta hydrolase-fold protein [Gemmatimonadota bacterium]